MAHSIPRTRDWTAQHYLEGANVAIRLHETAEDRAEREAAEYRFNTSTLVDVRTIAIVTCQAERVVRKAIADGEIKVVRIGRSIRIPTAPLRRAWGMDA